MKKILKIIAVLLIFLTLSGCFNGQNAYAISHNAKKELYRTAIKEFFLSVDGAKLQEIKYIEHNPLNNSYIFNVKYKIYLEETGFDYTDEEISEIKRLSGEYEEDFYITMRSEKDIFFIIAYDETNFFKTSDYEYQEHIFIYNSTTGAIARSIYGETGVTALG